MVGLYHWGLSKYDGRSCVSGLRTCQQVGDRSNQIENRIIPDCELLRERKIDSYYLLSVNTIDEFTNITCQKIFNIFHSSVDGYECHSDGLQEILPKSSINFDVVCLSETSQQSDHVFPKNGTLIALPLRSPL